MTFSLSTKLFEYRKV